MTLLQLPAPTAKPSCVRHLIEGARPTPEELAEADELLAYHEATGPGAALPPTEGEGRGEPGEDLGPADPADDWDVPLPPPDDEDPDAWPAWGPGDRAALGPGPGERLTLLGYLEHQRGLFLAVGSDAADLIADAIGDLASEVRILGCPADAATLLDRRGAMLAAR